jgi:hypothetical protein
MTIMKTKPKISRKLKKALKQCIFYYDGFYLIFPGTKKHPVRRTKWMYRVIGRYDAIGMRPYMSDDGLKKYPITNTSKLIDRCITHIYYSDNSSYNRKRRLKDYRKKGLIFVYARNGVVYPKGAWIPKERPKGHYYKTINCNTKECKVVHEIYDYKTRSYVCTEYVMISMDEFDDKNAKPKELFFNHKDTIIKNDVDIW